MKTFITLSITGMILLSFIYQQGYRVNLSASYPVGIYQITPTQDYKKGDLVSFCPPMGDTITKAIERDYLKQGTCPSGSVPLIKRIMATAGDHIQFDEVVSINGQAYKEFPIHHQDKHGCSLPQLVPLTLQKNEFLLLSDYAPTNSFDGRYFGAVAQKAILGTTIPIWTHSH